MQVKVKAYSHTISWKTRPKRKRALKVLAAELNSTEGELVDNAIETVYGKRLDKIESNLKDGH